MTSPSKWLKLLNAELDHASDRSCAIVAASIIETLLVDLLKATLVAPPAPRDEFFEGANGPISTFSARIDLGYHLGLIGGQMTRDLHIIRRIRNDFAHAVVGPSFSEGGISSQVEELLRSLQLRERAPFLLTSPYDTARGRFLICAIMFVMYLEHRLQPGPKHVAAASLDAVYTEELVEAPARDAK